MSSCRIYLLLGDAEDRVWDQLERRWNLRLNSLVIDITLIAILVILLSILIVSIFFIKLEFR